MNLLETIVEEKLYLFVDKQPSNWEDAIRLSCQPLKDKGIVDERFSEEIIKNVLKYGPYIVLLPNMAMPHTTISALGVFGTAISFTRLPEPVIFDENDREKDAQYFFTLAATDKDKHMENMEKLFTFLTMDNVLDELYKIGNLSDLKNIAQQIK